MQKNTNRAVQNDGTGKPADTNCTYGFDLPFDRLALSTKKWEAEIERLDDPSLLCLGVAEMDFHTAPAVLDAIAKVTAQGHFGYPHKRQSYFDAITSFYERSYGWQLQPEWIDSHVGIYPSLQPLIEELTDPGDEIIYQPPVHHIFEEMIRCNDRIAVANPLSVTDGYYTMDMDGLSALVSDRTKMLLLCSPHNPVGRVWTQHELEDLSTFCIDHGIIIVTDEVYFGLINKGQSFIPMATISKEAAMNTVTLTSVSKSFNLTGLKHSLVIAQNPEFRRAFQRGIIRSNLHFGGCIFGQAATEAALTGGDDWRSALMNHIQSNFVFLQTRIKENFPQVIISQPQATYFAWLDLRCLDMTADRLKDVLEKEAHVVVTFGEPMGPGGEGHIRINLATTRQVLGDGLKRLVDALQKHSQTTPVR